MLAFLYQEVCFKSWWVCLFILICGIGYEQILSKQDFEITKFKNRLLRLNEEKKSLQQKNEELLLEINSQSDPQWNELVLIKGLGLVPEGYQKIFFENDN